MKHLEVVSIGSNKGAPRIWIEGRKALAGGFTPGSRYTAKVDPEKCLLTLEQCDQGMRIVSKKTKGDKEFPVIDLNSQQLLSIFDGLARKFHGPSTAPEFLAGKMDKRPGRGYLLKSWAFLWIQDELPPTPDAQRVGDALGRTYGEARLLATTK